MKECNRAKSDMTPCVLRDGEISCTKSGVCVGCGHKVKARSVHNELVTTLSNMCQAVQEHFDRNGRAPGMQELSAARAALAHARGEA